MEGTETDCDYESDGSIMPKKYDKSFSILGDAKKYADACAERDSSEWLVMTNLYANTFAVGEIHNSQLYAGEKIVYRAKPSDPNKITIELTKYELKEWQEYLETERPALRYFEGFKGGMYATPIEKTLIQKLKGFIAA